MKLSPQTTGKATEINGHADKNGHARGELDDVLLPAPAEPKQEEPVYDVQADEPLARQHVIALLPEKEARLIGLLIGPNDVLDMDVWRMDEKECGRVYRKWCRLMDQTRYRRKVWGKHRDKIISSIPDWMAVQPDLGAVGKMILAEVYRMAIGGLGCWKSNLELATRLRKKVGTIREHISKLLKQGWLLSRHDHRTGRRYLWLNLAKFSRAPSVKQQDGTGEIDPLFASAELTQRVSGTDAPRQRNGRSVSAELTRRVSGTDAEEAQKNAQVAAHNASLPFTNRPNQEYDTRVRSTSERQNKTKQDTDAPAARVLSCSIPLISGTARPGASPPGPPQPVTADGGNEDAVIQKAGAPVAHPGKAERISPVKEGEAPPHVRARATPPQAEKSKWDKEAEVALAELDKWWREWTDDPSAVYSAISTLRFPKKRWLDLCAEWLEKQPEGVDGEWLAWTIRMAWAVAQACPKHSVSGEKYKSDGGWACHWLCDEPAKVFWALGDGSQFYTMASDEIKKLYGAKADACGKAVETLLEMVPEEWERADKFQKWEMLWHAYALQEGVKTTTMKEWLSRPPPDAEVQDEAVADKDEAVATDAQGDPASSGWWTDHVKAAVDAEGGENEG